MNRWNWLVVIKCVLINFGWIKGRKWSVSSKRNTFMLRILTLNNWWWLNSYLPSWLLGYGCDWLKLWFPRKTVALYYVHNVTSCDERNLTAVQGCGRMTHQEDEYGRLIKKMSHPKLNAWKKVKYSNANLQRVHFQLWLFCVSIEVKKIR